MKKTTKLISILLVMAMLLSMAPLSLNAFASANDKLFLHGSFIRTNGYAVTIEAGSKSGYSKVKVDGEYVDFSACKYSSGDPMFTLGNSNYEADLSKTSIYGPSASMTGDLHITMTGGVVKYLAGGCSGSDSVLTGNVYITMTGGKVTEIWGTEYNVNGDINVTMTGGTVTSYINLLYRISQ